MCDALVVPRCSRCNTPLRAGELVGLQKDLVLCCMCLDLRTSTLSVIDRTGRPIDPREHLKKASREHPPRQKIM